ncbi:FecR domain-containing protein [Carboxylicivirga sediminis]|uniref:FecR domain-containing protein n=1 Tax=Carboxylicivirga sediminis TaxID=2006564 RepID=A0A941IYX6_9BACT|nr:FecR domain-containing protein [Carboxylicivirga sediminis]MBR8536954.1 FecR domain-containing protein [Carboxylicivirga sediminis]
MQKQPPIDSIIAELDASISKDEKSTLEQWQAQAPENKSFVKAFKFIWQNTGSRHNLFTVRTDEALIAVHKRITRRRLIRQVSSVAALIICILLSGIAYKLLSSQTQTIQLTAQQQQSITLPDSTTVILAKGSTVVYPPEFSSTKRTIKLIGKAWFNVHHNTSQPFTVETQHGATTVLGTKFTLCDEPTHALQLFLDEGKVVFKAKQWFSQPLHLAPGEMISMVNDEYTISLQPNLNASSWATKTLIFKNTPLNEVTKELEAYYNIHISLKQKQIAKLRFSGQINETEPLTALEIIALTLNLKLIKESTSFSLSL